MSLKQGISLTIRDVVAALTIGVLFASTNALAAAPSHENLVAINKETHEDRRELLCLATNIYHEAGGESDRGKAAVAHVTLNRAKSPRYPNDICKVVYQKSTRTCQFSWTCDGRSDIVPNKTYNKRWQDSLQIALLVIDKIIKDPTNGAMFFHERTINPGWRRLVRTAHIGNHIFYRHG